MGAPAPAPASPAGVPFSSRLFAWLGPPWIALAFVALAWWTWGTWPDVLIDFGRELYAPWRLAEGDVLYRDLAWFNGPLSAGFNALLFETFGASLATLVWANLTLLALFTALVYGLLRAVADPLSATVATLTMLAATGFAQLVGIGNYNFVCPYSHEVTHGLILGLASIGCLRAWDGRRSAVWVLLAGLGLGLCFLTKAEVFLAALLADATALGLYAVSEPRARACRVRICAGFAGAALLPVVVAFVLFARALPAGEALRATLGSWPWVLAGGAEDLRYYREGMGLDAPWTRLGELATWSGWWLLLLGPAAALALRVRRGSSSARIAVPISALVAGAIAWWALDESSVFAAGPPSAPLPLTLVARPFPLFVLVLGVWLALRFARSAESRRTGRIELALCVWALLLLAKMILNARLIHYGFALALPALLLVVVALVGWLPALIDARGRSGWVLRAVALALIAVVATGYVRRTGHFVALKTTVVGEGSDAFRADPRGVLVNQALAELERRAGPDDTLAVFPEGVMLNWLARRANPTPYVNFMPPELMLFGEERIRDAFRDAPPDWVLLVHKDTTEYGFPLFGPDYGRLLARWIQQGYERVLVLGDPPLERRFAWGIALLKRRQP